jgi:hypothetical protein
MRIGFAGAQCSGKTTQATLLSERDGFIAVPSASRLAANMGVPVNREGTLSTQLVIIGKIESQQYEYKQSHLVWERTHVDALAYSQTCDLWGIEEHYLICHRALAKAQIVNYFDIVFYFPAYELSTFKGETVDGVRDVEPAYRQRVATIIKNELDMIGKPYFVVPEGDPELVYNYICKRLFPSDFFEPRIFGEVEYV